MKAMLSSAFACCTVSMFIMFWMSASVFAQNVFYAPSVEDFPNPERGFYIQDSPYSVQLMRDARRNHNITTIRSYHRLDDYVNSQIPQSFLDDMQAGLNRVRDAGAKMIIRFSYNFGYEGTDASESRILEHIDQLGPVLAQNSDVIALVEAGFIGAWGEWHSSDNGLDNNDSRRNILFRLLSYLPDDRMVAVRVNSYKREIFENDIPLSVDSAFSGSYRARTGAHNDCLGASENDWGTYKPECIEAEKDFLNQDNLYVVQEGETCNENPPYSTCGNILPTLQRMRWDLLNINYHQGVLQSWVDGGCMEEIKRKLGYRFRMVNAQIDDIIDDGILSASIEIINDGWGKIFNPRSLELILRETGGSNEFVFPLNDDPGFWSPGETIILNIEQEIPQSVPLGTYELFLNLPDPSTSLHDRPDYSIRLANENVWEAATGYNSLLHNVQVNSVTAGITEKEINPVGNFVVYPNPSTSKTNISFYLAKSTNITITVFNSQGQVVKQLVDDKLDAGKQLILWDGDNNKRVNTPAGFYWLVFTSEATRNAEKIIKLE